MLFEISDEGIAGMRELAKEMHKCSESLSQAAIILNSEALQLAPGLGNYATPISQFVDDVLSQSVEIKNASTVLEERLFIKAEILGSPGINLFQ